MARWNTIKIATSNAPLLNAAKHYLSSVPEEIPTEIRPLLLRNDTVEANIYCEDGVSAQALCAMYDASGQLVSTQTVGLTSGENNELTFTGYNPTLTTKIMVIDSNTTAPLCAAVSAKK